MNYKNKVLEGIKKAGGITRVANQLRVNSNTVGRWIKLGYIPRFDQAEKLAVATGMSIELFRKQDDVQAEEWSHE